MLSTATIPHSRPDVNTLFPIWGKTYLAREGLSERCSIVARVEVILERQDFAHCSIVRRVAVKNTDYAFRGGFGVPPHTTKNESKPAMTAKATK